MPDPDYKPCAGAAGPWCKTMNARLGERTAADGRLYVIETDGARSEIRSVSDFPRYFVTENGKVYSRWNPDDNQLRRRVLTTDKDGYEWVDLYFGKRKKLHVHTLVALAFVGERPFEEAEIRHLDGKKLNNHYSNLAWGTHEENVADRRQHGGYRVDANYGNARLNEVQVREIRNRRLAGERLADIAADYRITQSAVSSIAKRKCWKDVA